MTYEQEALRNTAKSITKGLSPKNKIFILVHGMIKEKDEDLKRIAALTIFDELETL